MGVAGGENGVAIIHPMLSDSCTKLAKQQAARKGEGSEGRVQCAAYAARQAAPRTCSKRRSTMDYAASVGGREGGREGRKGRKGRGLLFARVILLALTAFVVLLFFMSVKNWQAASKTGHAR